MWILYKSLSGLPFLSTWKKHLVPILKYLALTCQQCVFFYWLTVWTPTCKNNQSEKSSKLILFLQCQVVFMVWRSSMGFSVIIELEMLQCFQILSFDFYTKGYSFKNICISVAMYKCNHHHKFNTYYVVSTIHSKNPVERDQTRSSLKVSLICVTLLSDPLRIWSRWLLPCSGTTFVF